MEITCSSANSFTKPILTTTGKSQPGPSYANSQRRVLTLRCCSIAISSPLDDNKAPTVHPDWRSYRAKLVTNEQSTRPQGSSNLPMDVKPVENHHHPRVTNENTRAHILEEPKKVDSKCSIGVILNKPSSMTRSAVTNGPLYFGGLLDDDLVPVSLMENDDEKVMIKKSRIFEEQTSLCCVDEMVKRNELRVEDFRVFEGYCWWDNKKLRDEIKSGWWKVIACIPNIFTSLN
ncbi:hypothetical protein MKW94_029670 [Papaver nudicaule]|uniref:Uncharacterized protein n=1 Tax=Papaver nudicaule TaxID=74823 RepID=A0AA41V6S0_PAPNU|nr:hypothetical protein [Papaver nudicaule]